MIIIICGVTYMCCLLAYQTLYESSVAFGMRKALQAEQGKSVFIFISRLLNFVRMSMNFANIQDMEQEIERLKEVKNIKRIAF